MEVGQYQGLAKPPQTVLGRVAEERRGMAKWITGSEADDLPSVQRQIADRYAAIRDAGRIDSAKDFDPAGQMPLVAAVGNLADSLGKERDRRTQAENNLKAAQVQITDLTRARDQAKQNFSQAVADIESQLKATTAQLESYQKAKDAEVESLKGNATKAEEQLSKANDRHRAELEEKGQELTKMRNHLNDALTKLREP